MRAPLTARRETFSAELQLALACLTVAAGCLLLGLQVDGTGAVVGTGRTTFAIGVVVALVALLFRSAREATAAAKQPGVGPWLPRDLVSMAAVVTGFFGLACVVAGVLAPGGGWMFFELLLIISLLAFHQSRGKHFAPVVGIGSITLLALMLIFRLWITWQGSEHRWAVMSIDVPILSGLPISFLDPVRRVSLGSFTPSELGFPPAGLDFHVSMTIWALGFVLCIAGMRWGSHAAREHENDRIQDTIDLLPGPLANVVAKVLPEEDWEELGLHGLSDRLRKKRIEALFTERLAHRREIDSALRSLDLLSLRNPGGFTGEIYEVLARQDALLPEATAKATTNERATDERATDERAGNDPAPDNTTPPAPDSDQ